VNDENVSESNNNEEDENNFEANDKSKANAKLHNHDSLYPEGDDFALSSDMYSFSTTLTIALVLFVIVLIMCGGWTRFRRTLVVIFQKGKGSRISWTGNGYKPLPHWSYKLL